MYSAVHFNRFNSKIHYWEYDQSGTKQHKIEDAPLYFFMKSDDGDYKSIYGDTLKKVEFESYSRYRDVKEMYKAANKELFESDVDIENRFILDKYSKEEIIQPVLDVHFIDIEVHSEKGFPKPDTADHPITIITVYSTKHKRWFVWAEKEFSVDFDIKIKKGNKEKNEPDEVVKFSSLKPWVKIFDDEVELLKSFVSFVKKLHPDVISGWNSNGYDIPYIINRTTRLLGEDFVKNLSPIKHIRKIISKNRFGKEVEGYEIAGINLVDYLDLYKKYHQSQQESYKLDYIARVEIDETKLEYEGSIKDLYKNWQKYCEYNIQDVNLLVLLDDRIKYMNMMFGICYNCKVQFEQFHKTTKVLDGAFISRLSLNKIILPDVKYDEFNEGKYVGAYVKDPQVGIFDWVISFDATSLYPSIMMQHNISPETKMYVVPEHITETIVKYLEEPSSVLEEDLNVYATTEKKVKDVINDIKLKKYTIASNGAVYRSDIIGIIPKFVKEWFDKRQLHKNLMKKAAKDGNSAEEQLQNGLQQNYKILINSVYGYAGSKFSRLYDLDNAIAVTATGQAVLKTSMESVDNFFGTWSTSDLGKKINANDAKNVVIYGDTDSLYISAGRILKSFNYPHYENNEKCYEFLKQKVEPMITNIIEKAMINLTQIKMNCSDTIITFKREMIARRSVFIGKKNYAAWVYDLEGKVIKEGDDHEVEAKGLEMVKSSTPEWARKHMKKIILNILKNNDQVLTNKDIQNVRLEFFESEPEKIAKISNVNNLEKYSDSIGMPILGTPGHVKAALGYNILVERNNLEDLYEKITEGDKIKYVSIKPNNVYQFGAIAFKNKFPKEFGLDLWVDYDTMFEKVMTEPMNRFYEVLGWKMPNFELEDITDLFV